MADDENRWQPLPLESGWASSNPVVDLQAWQKKIADTTGYQPTKLIMSSKQKTALKRWRIWYEETKWRLEATPRRKWITRRVLERQLYGHLTTSTSVLRWSQLQARMTHYNIQHWIRRHLP